MKSQKSSGKPRKLRAPILIRRVVGHSMVPSLPPGTLVIAFGYFRKINPGHVVIIKHEGKEKVKRIDQIKDSEIYVVGDHPETSTDSRHFGWLPHESIKGKIFWPRPGKD